MNSGKIRMSILNTPDGLSPLKITGWLRQEAADIQSNAENEDELIIIRLFIPQRLILAITEKKLDKVLQGIVDKFSNIQTVELRGVAKSLSFEEMMKEQEYAREDIRSFIDAANEINNDNSSAFH